MEYIISKDLKCRWAEFGLVFVLYFIGARIGVAFTSMPEGTAVLWPPNAVLLASYLLLGRAGYPGVSVAALLAELAADIPTFTVIEALSFGFINIFEATLAALLLRRLRFDANFPTIADLVKFIVAGPLIASLAAALPGAFVYLFFRGGETSYLEFVRLWWFGDALGLLILTPLLLNSFIRPEGNSAAFPAVSRRSLLEILSIILAGGVIVFWQDDEVFSGILGSILLVPISLYIAARFDLRATTVTVAAFALMVIVATTRGIDLFGVVDPRLVVLHAQEFVFLMSVMALGLSALLSVLRQRQHDLAISNASLDALNRDLEAIVAARTRELVTLNAQLAHQALTDPLTGALNRRGLEQAAGREIARRERLGGEISLILFDLDHFKSINDRFGHDVGDAVLRETAAVVARTIRREDLFARHGGEEFAVLLQRADFGEACQLAERIRTAIAAAPLCADRTPVTASFGVTQLRPGEDFSWILKRADGLLYTAKQNGRNRVAAECVEEAEMSPLEQAPRRE